MRFEIGNNVDESVVKVIMHEFSRCELALKMFTNLREMKRQSNRIDKKLNLSIYNAYSLFVTHLYEYLKGCIIREKKNTNVRDKDYEEVDRIINGEVEKILKLWRERIDNQTAPSWANARSYYEDNCPEEFSKHFRDIRNNVNHADYRRVDGGNRITLTDFYLKYHKYMMLLYDNGKEWWSIKDFNEIDLGDISNFSEFI